jgi:Na+-driven multidrug efflux pump
MQSIKKFVILTLVAVIAFPLTAHAYVGPGLGLGVVGTVLGVMLSILLALLAIFWYPFKRLFSKFRKKKKNNEDN